MNRILVIDDEQGMRDFLSIMLKKEGYEVIAAGNGEHALKAIHTEIYDLVITDVKMPRVDGIEVLRTIKEVSPETVVIVITAFATTDAAVQAINWRLRLHHQPFKVDEIKLIIKSPQNVT
jgi:two-component system response regulator PilR (NtrC family)